MRMLEQKRYRKIAHDQALKWTVSSEMPAFFVCEGKMRILNQDLDSLYLTPECYQVLEIHVRPSGSVFLLYNAAVELLCYVWLSRTPEAGDSILDWDKRCFEFRAYGFDDTDRVHIAEQWQENDEFFALLRLSMSADLEEPKLLVGQNYRDIVRLGRSVLSIRSATDPTAMLQRFGFLVVDGNGG